MHIGARGLLASLLLIAFCDAGWSDGPAPEKPLTQRDVNKILETEVAPGHTERAEPPQSIKPLSKADKKVLKAAHRRVISGEDWKAETPQQRDEHIRQLRENNEPGTFFLIDVATGDVWKLPPLPGPRDPNELPWLPLSKEHGVTIVYFLVFDFRALPAAVGHSSYSHGDRGGTPLDREEPEEL